MDMLNKEQKEKLEDIIEYIINSIEYKKCIEIKNIMKSNTNINKLINDIKILQKKYIKNNYDKELKLELNRKEEELNKIPIYVEYNLNLSKVNEMINLVKEELNDYFYNKLNKDIDI